MLIAILSAFLPLNAGIFDGCWSFRPGFYIGTHFGYASIQFPTHGALVKPNNTITGDRGDFAYGVFTGYNFRTPCLDDGYFGVEAGYHDNGSTRIKFVLSENRYRIESRDFDILATFTYAFCQSYDYFLKVGGANVREQFKIFKVKNTRCAIEKHTTTQWAPVVETGIGYTLFKRLNLSLSYRGVFGGSKNTLNDRLTGVIIDHEPHYSWKGISTVQSIYGDVSLLF